MLLIYFITAAFGMIGVLGQSKGKLIGLAVLLVLMAGVVLVMTRVVGRRKLLLDMVDKNMKK